MQQRGRKSSASLSVVKEKVVGIDERPAPPAHLTPEQAVEWKAIVNALPLEWFGPESLGLLEEYVQHITSARRIGELLKKIELQDKFNIEDYDRLLKMKEREARIMASLAGKMRISQSSTYDEKTKKPKQRSQRPWE